MSNKAGERTEKANKARIRALEGEVRHLKSDRDRQLPFGWSELVRWIPELDHLHRALLEAVWLADPRKARSTAAVGKGGGYSAPDHPAPDTIVDRERIRGARNAIAGLVRDAAYELASVFLHPHEVQDRFGKRYTPRHEGPRCQRSGCKSKRRRQTPGQPWCGWCGAPLPGPDLTVRGEKASDKAPP